MKALSNLDRWRGTCRIGVRRLSLLLAAGAMSVAMAGPVQSQQTLWNIYVNLYGTPPTLGVAPLNWSSNGWIKQAGPYYSQRQAWDVVCRMVATNRYRSPDIEQGLVAC